MREAKTGLFYQLEYDKCLGTKSFLYEEKNEIISGVGIWLRFDSIFYNEDVVEGRFDIGYTSDSLSGLVRVGYDPKTKAFSFSPDDAIVGKYSVVGYTKDVQETIQSDLSKELDEIVGFHASFSEAVYIEKDEFDFIIEKYGHLFDPDDWLQNCAYSYEEVRLFEDYVEVKAECSYFVYNPKMEQVLVAICMQKDDNQLIWQTGNGADRQLLPLDALKPVKKSDIPEDMID